MPNARAKPSASESIAAPSISMPHVLRRSAFAGAALFSIALHAGVILACVESWKPTSLGAIELPTNVVSIELTASQVLEAQPQRQREEPASAMAAVAPVEGNAEETAERAHEAPRPDVTPPEPTIAPPDAKPEPAAAVPLEPQSVADAEAVPAGPVEEKKAPAVVEPAKPEPKKEEAKQEDQEKKEETKHEEWEEKKETRKETRKGGVTSRARSGKGAGNAHASASRGSVLTYAAYVRARVAGNKPSGSGHRGTVTIAFGVTTSGRLAYASIARSSGDFALDRLALGAVRGATPFPPPPLGATPGQLRFSIAFHFQ